MPTNTDSVPQDMVNAKITPEGGVKFERTVQEKPNVLAENIYPHVKRAQDRLALEMEAGKAKVAAAEERRSKHVPAPLSSKERAAQGTSTPVFRPNDFTEYAKNFKSPAIARSKDG